MASKRQRVNGPSSHGTPPAENATAETQSSDATYIRPRTRQRVQKAPPPLTVPNISEDATERKRVLNVLAQRRYRERRRQGRTQPVRGQSQSSPDDDVQPRSGGPSTNTTGDDDQPRGDGVNYVEPSTEADAGMAGSTQATTGPVGTKSPSAVHFFNLDFTAPLSPGMLDVPDSALEELAAQTEGLPNFILDGTRLNLEDEASSANATPANLPFTIDPAALLDTSSAGPSSTALSSSSYPSPDTSSGVATTPSADSYLLPVNELTLLRAFLRIATRLGSSGSLWDLEARSPFCAAKPTAEPTNIGIDIGGSGPAGPDPALLPPTWQPTASQVLVPHHPMLDFLPWPSARDRIIEVFGLPESARPPAAAGPLALVEFAYDVEDGAEGMRIWGADPFDPSSWEVGQVLFEKWWFVFDRGIVEQSNRWRALRGAGSLTMKEQGGGFSMGL